MRLTIAYSNIKKRNKLVLINDATYQIRSTHSTTLNTKLVCARRLIKKTKQNKTKQNKTKQNKTTQNKTKQNKQTNKQTKTFCLSLFIHRKKHNF